MNIAKLLFCLYALCSPLMAEEFVTVEKRGVTHKFAKMDGGWVDQFTANLFKCWEEDTFDTFEMVADKNGVALDIGAWIGTTAIWLSHNFYHVIAVEADSESMKYLKMNLAESGANNVTICDKALTNKEGTVFFGPRSAISDNLNFSTSYVKDSCTSKNDYAVDSLSFQQLLDGCYNNNPALNHHKITFIKCDIEGGEERILEDVLNYAYKNDCRVWMSFHTCWWKEKKLADYTEILGHFNAICPKGDVIGYIEKNPLGSVLLIPKRIN